MVKHQILQKCFFFFNYRINVVLLFLIWLSLCANIPIFCISLHYCCGGCCLVASVISDSVRPHRQQPTKLPSPWDSPGKDTGVGCHLPLQRMKIKSESKVAQSCPTLSNPMDCSLPGSSVHGIFQARVLEWVPLPSPVCTIRTQQMPSFPGDIFCFALYS